MVQLSLVQLSFLALAVWGIISGNKARYNCHIFEKPNRSESNLLAVTCSMSSSSSVLHSLAIYFLTSRLLLVCIISISYYMPDECLADISAKGCYEA